MVVTPRLRRRIEQDFPNSADEVERLLATTECGGQDSERVRAAVVFAANGDITRLRDGVELSKQDWRDALVAGGLADEDWSSVLDASLTL
jgi:hypothetical protein